MRDPISVFQSKLKKYRIKGNQLAAAAADRSPQNISEILNRKSSPTLDSFNHLINTCDEIAPGFADDFYGSLASERLNLTQFVNSLDSVELGMLLVVAGQRIQEKQMMAVAS
jgi:hypothetical protein